MSNKLDHKVWDEIYEACKDGGLYKGSDFQWNVWDRWPNIWGKYILEGDRDKINKAILEAYRIGEIRDRGAMEPEVFRVRVVSGGALYWYNDKIGEVFDVIDDWQYGSKYRVLRPARFGLDGVHYITKENCEIVTDEPEGEPCFVVQMPDGRIIKPTGYEGIPSGNGIYCHPDETWYKLDPAKFDGLVDDPGAFALACFDKNRGVWNISEAIISGGLAKKRGKILVEFYKAGTLRRGGPMPEVEVCETCGQEINKLDTKGEQND